MAKPDKKKPAVKEPEVKKTTAQVPAVRTGAVPATAGPNVPEFVQPSDAGKGTSQAQEDNLVPLIYILQALSPAVNKRKPEYIEGAEAGDIWLRNASQQLVKGEDGILFQPCFFSKDFVEWVPRDSGGGFVGRHQEMPDDVKREEDKKNPNKVHFFRPNGNEVIETRYHVGYVHLESGARLPYVIPMASSGHTVSRQWMFMMNSIQIANGIAPSFSRLYRLKTKERTNTQGTWFTWDITDEGWVQSPEDYAKGRALEVAFSDGAKAMETPVADIREDAGDGTM